MAFGFPAYHNEKRNLTVEPDVARAIARKALFNMGLTEIGYHKEALDFKTKGTAMTLSERILIYIGKIEILAHSECLFPTQFIDFGKNKKNVEAFWQEYERLLKETKQSSGSLDKRVAEE
jgi:hypothetical protein